MKYNVMKFADQSLCAGGETIGNNFKRIPVTEQSLKNADDVTPV